MNKKENVEEFICEVDEEGNKHWYINHKPYRKLHRENDLPAIEYYNGDKEWWLNGLRHRENGLPAVKYNNGSKEWRLNGRLHRENDKPAVEWFNGDKGWYLNGQLHREKGPAIEYNDGIKRWYWYGEEIEVKSQEEFEEKLPYLIMKDIHEQ